MTPNAILILAAGNSSRMGKPKQLLPYKNTSLLGYTLDQVTPLIHAEVFVVTGAYQEFVEKEAASYSVRTVFNPTWKQGMGSSISQAVHKITTDNQFQRILITLCDLPLLNHRFYKAILEFHSVNSHEISRTSYTDTKGVPVVFEHTYFQELKTLKSDEGAKALLRNHKERVADFNWPEPYFDVDTPESYQKLLLREESS